MGERRIDFYFDMVSPFSYLAHVKLPELAERHGCSIAYHPIDLPQAKMAAGNYGPSNREVPAKIRVMAADLERWAQRYRVPLRFPKGFDCSRWNIAALLAAERARGRQFVTEGYARIWGTGIDPSDEGELRAAATAAGLAADEVVAYASSPRGGSDFRKACVEAHRRGVFGAPLMFVDDEIYWGNDRLDFLEEYLESRPLHGADVEYAAAP